MESLAAALDSAAEAARAAGASIDVEDAKSGNSAADAVAKPAAGSKTKAPAAAAPVAAKPAKAGKAKAPPITFEALKAKLSDVVDNKGKEAAREILSAFGAAKLVDLEEDDYEKAYSDAVAALAEEVETETTDDSDDMFGA